MCGYFWGHDKIGVVLGVFSMYFRVFLKVNVQNENFLRGKNFKYFLRCLIFPIFFWRQTVDAGPNPIHTCKNISKMFQLKTKQTRFIVISVIFGLFFQLFSEKCADPDEK